MISVIYGAAVAVSLILLIGYLVFVKKKDVWLLFLFVSVLFVNVGYFSISTAHILEEALLANRISYLGSVFLPLCMLMSISDVCEIKIPKGLITLLMSLGVAVFLLAASPGYSDVYYKDVTLAVVDGVSKLVKEYGKLHIVYLFYLISYFAAMIFEVCYAIFKKKLTSYKYASMLTAVVFLNILIWLLEQLISIDFEMLSISYIASEIMLLFLFGIIQDYNDMKTNEQSKKTLLLSETPPQQDKITENLSEHISLILDSWNVTEPLTVRELEVLQLILDNYKRKEIAEKLSLSENTVKTHTTHIFSKLSVTDRTELFEKAYAIISGKQVSIT